MGKNSMGKNDAVKVVPGYPHVKNNDLVDLLAKNRFVFEMKIMILENASQIE